MLREITIASWLTKNVLAHRANVHLTLTVSVKAINMHPLSTIWVCAFIDNRGGRVTLLKNATYAQTLCNHFTNAQLTLLKNACT